MNWSVDPEPFDVASDKDCPGSTILQYGQYYGKCFEWVLQNDPSHIIYLGVDYFGQTLDDMKSDKEKILFSLVNVFSCLSSRILYP